MYPSKVSHVIKCHLKIIIPLVILFAFAAHSLEADEPKGESLFIQNCAACHQPGGTGVPGAYPALMGSPVVAGDADTVIKVILAGPAKVLPADRPKYSGQMPPITWLSDANIAALVTYIRTKFGNGAAPVDAAQVSKVKASLKQ